MTPTLILSAVVALGVAAAGAGLYLEGKKAGRNEQIAKQAAIEDVAQEAAQRTARLAAEAISKITVRHTTVRQELEREVLTREVFRDCRSGPDAVRLLNQSPGVAASAPVAAGRPELPASGPAD